MWLEVDILTVNQHSSLARWSVSNQSDFLPWPGSSKRIIPKALNGSYPAISGLATEVTQLLLHSIGYKWVTKVWFYSIKGRWYRTPTSQWLECWGIWWYFLKSLSLEYGIFINVLSYVLEKTIYSQLLVTRFCMCLVIASFSVLWLKSIFSYFLPVC